MRPISRLRFNALAGYAKHSLTAVYAEELGWFEHANELPDHDSHVLAAAILPRSLRWRCKPGEWPEIVVWPLALI